VLVGGELDVFLQSADGRIERFEQRQVGLDAATDAGVVDVRGDGGSFGLVFDVVGDGRQVELASGGVDVAVQLSALADRAQACSQQVTQSASLFGVGVGGREVAAFEQSCDGFGIFAIALRVCAKIT
jgi:hypothetical protein